MSEMVGHIGVGVLRSRDRGLIGMWPPYPRLGTLSKSRALLQLYSTTILSGNFVAKLGVRHSDDEDAISAQEQTKFPKH